MTIRKFSLPSIKQVHGGNRTDYFVVGEMSDLFDLCKANVKSFNRGGTEWTGHMHLQEALQCLDRGHPDSVPPSDKFLKDLEDILPAPTARHEIIDDVAGAFPNVPAMLAGQPLNMRRKMKRENEAAPIALVADLVLSGGLSMEDMQQRGAAILALARALSSRRPVELWACAGLQAYGRDAQWLLFRIETSPLDLARAAFVLSHPAMTRGLFYRLGEALHDFGGAWPYSDDNSEGRRYGRQIIGRALPHVEDMIFVPCAHLHDQNVKNPVQWVRDNVKAYLGDDGVMSAA